MILGGLVEAGQEKLCVCDLFGDQESNVSESGSGDREILYRNLKPTIERGVELEVIQKNSNALSVEEIGSHYRFYHIDGGHNADETLFDLRLAASCVIDKGVIAIDDPFRHEWPGVTEAIVRFLDEFADFRAIVSGSTR